MAQQVQALATHLLGASPSIVAVREMVEQLLRQTVGHRLPPILIHGETGTGKGLLARTIHDAGPRRGGPFVDINCAAIPEHLLEAELFGFERGAFTDARRAKPGLFQTAHGGTLFLDEIGLLPEPLQAKLLKVLEERAVRRLGGTQSEPVDVAILAATNADLVAEVQARRFRQDLYHRLAVFSIELPPLRERPNDLLLLAEHFVRRACDEYGLTPKTLTPDATAALARYPWPGNVRELANVIERAALLAEGTVLTSSMLGLKTEAPRTLMRVARSEAGAGRSVAQVEERLVLEALEATSWNISKTAAQLGIARNTLKARIKKFKLRPGVARAIPREPPRESVEPVERVELTARAASATAAGVQWETRRLAILRAALAAPEEPRGLDVLIQKAEAFGGRIVEIGVASLVATFGLEPVEDAPRRAALAALAMQKAWSRVQVAPRAPKAAIHTALAPVARIGDTLDIDGDAKRRIWSVLDALIGAAEPGAVLVTRPALTLLARRFQVADTSAIATAAGPGYRLTDYRATPFDVGGHIGRFVGRVSELDLLRTRFEAARAGQGQVVALAGDAGIGKSRLLFELRQTLADQPLIYLEGHCFSYGTTIPYLPILEAVRACCQLADSDTPEEMAAKVRAALTGGRAAPGASVAFVLHLLGVKDETRQITTLAPAALKAGTFDAIRALFTATAQREPVVLAIEDLHWVDTASEALLASLVEAVSGTRILLVCTYRPGYRPAWLDRSYATQVALSPLAPDESLSIVRVVLGAQELAAPLADVVLAKAEGNPLFLEELARAAREQDPAAATLKIPDTVQEVLQARIDRLPPAERRLLQSAAVIGKNFAFDILRALADGADDDVREVLRRLQAAEFVHETGLVPDSEYTFKHFLTHDVAYESLAAEERKRLHGRVVAAMERLWPEPRTEHAEVLAEHTVRAEVWDKAVDYLRAAGAKAWQRGAIAETIGRYQAALAIATREGHTDEMTRRAIDARLDLHAPLMTAGRLKAIAELYPEAERLARKLGDRPRLFQVLQRTSQLAWMGGQYERGADCARQALEVGEKATDTTTRLQAHYYLGQNLHALGDYPEAIGCFARIVEGADARIASRVILLTTPMDVPARCWLGFSQAITGDFVHAEENMRIAVAAAEASDYPHSRVIARTMDAIVLAFAGRAAERLESLREATELCERIGFVIWLAAVYSTLGFALTRAGQHEAALPYLERAVRKNEETGVRSYHAQRLAWWAEGLLGAGRIDEARAQTDAALELAGKMKERGVEAEALLLRARVARAQADAGACERYERALAAATEIGAKLFEAHSHRGLGELLTEMKDTTAARKHVEAGEAMFREMRLG